MAIVVHVASNPFTAAAEGAKYIGIGFLSSGVACCTWALDSIHGDRVTRFGVTRIINASEACEIALGTVSYGILEVSISIAMVYVGAVVARRVVRIVAPPCLDNVRWIRTQWERAI